MAANGVGPMTAAILEQIDRAIGAWEELRSTSAYDSCSDKQGSAVAELVALMTATVDRLAPPGSRYHEVAYTYFKTAGPSSSNNVPSLVGALKALRADYAAGYLKSVQQLIHADIFSDFLEMADYLLNEGYKDPSAVLAGNEGYKDPSAVLAGGVLEEHLRKLCEGNAITTVDSGRQKKADRMNSDLAGGAIYSKLDQKNITAWLDLRNKAAHGKYDEYTADQVALMVQSVRDFLTRVPA